MDYGELKKIDKHTAMKIAVEGEFDFHAYKNSFPDSPAVIVYGSMAWESVDKTIDFINEYVNPKSEKELHRFLEDICKEIVGDERLDSNDYRQQLLVQYRMLYKQHLPLFGGPNKLTEWAESYGTYIWYSSILKERRQKQFLKIIKEHEQDKLDAVSAKIKSIYKFTDKEILYLQYFCSQTKCDDLDPTLNTMLYLWSNTKGTGKTTVGSYLCSFLNGESDNNTSGHTSELHIELQFDKFDIPNATQSRCTLIDEGGFADMSKSYNKFKQTITMNTCKVEFKFKSGKKPLRCYRNYILTDNDDPIYFVKDEDERRILSIHFKSPKRISWEELKEMWFTFVLECNLPASKLEEIYTSVIMPNSQAGEIKNIMTELVDIFTEHRINLVNGTTTHFSVAHVMSFNEIQTQKISRQTVKKVLTKMYGEPDSHQRFFKSNRKESFSIEQEDLPF